jgi:hypothetical protein
VRFGRTIHTNVIERLLVVFATVLELEDEQYFVKRCASSFRSVPYRDSHD